MKASCNLVPLLVFVVVMLLLAGCSKGRNVKDFTPATDKARQALEAGLNHVQSGNPPGEVPGTKPRVEFVDTKVKTGQIKAFEIVGEDSPTDDGAAPRFFKVRLTLAKGSPQDVRYAVFGIDPLMVYREEDYKALSGAGK